MTRSRLLIFFLVAAFAALLTVLILVPTRGSFLIATLALLAGLVSGLLLKGRRSSFGISNLQTENDQTVGVSAELLDATINEMREGLLVIDHEMCVLASNKAARNLLSNVDDRIELRRLTELTRNPAIYDAFLDALHGQERAGVKVETYNQGRQVFDLRVAPLRSSNGKGTQGAVGVFFDITRLERLEVIRQEFLSNVSHELRTPLTSIVALAETLETGALDDPENNRRFLAIIQKNAARMHRLIDDILELSAIEAGNVRIDQEIIPLRPLVEDIIFSLSATASTRNIAVRNLIPPATEVFADPLRLMQMLTNLIDNAIKFNRDNGTISIMLSRDDVDRITVEDTGEGIPSHHLDRLFERFYRVDRARSRELGGTGLGLAIVKHLARAHDGEVTVRSQLGEGTEFTIELPRQDTAEDQGFAKPISAG